MHGYRWSTARIVESALTLTQKERDYITVFYAGDNCMETFPDDMCTLFPNVEYLYCTDNQLLMLPFSLCTMTKLKAAHFTNNNLQRLPSSITRLVNLRSVELQGNASLPDEFQENTINCHATCSLQRRIGAYYGPIDRSCRKTIVTLLGIRQFRRVSTLAMIGKDVVNIIGKMMWADCVSGAWVIK